MPGSVLLGARSTPRLRSRAGYGAFVWLPVVVMLLVIARESTDAFSSDHTGAMLRPVVELVLGHLPNTRWQYLHHALRKTGHFLGYGLLGLAWLRAWLLTWLMPLHRQLRSVWQRWALAMALCCTAIIASLDELHQTWLPSRTGLATDVLLDTSGALALCTVVAMVWLTRRDALKR